MNQNELTSRLNKALGRIGEIPAGYARLGKGDGSGAIISSSSDRTVYIYETNLAGEVKLSQTINITAFSNLDINRITFEGLRVKLGYPPNDPTRLYVTSIESVEGMAALSGLTPTEQKAVAADYVDISRLLNFRLNPNDPQDLNIHVEPAPYYDLDGVWHWFGGDGLDDDFTTTVAALSGEHQMAVVYFDVTTGNLGFVTNTAEAGGAADKDIFDGTTAEELTYAAGYILVGAVHLYDGQVEIAESDIYRAFDVRVIFPTPTSGGGGTEDLTARKRSWMGL